MGFVYEKIPAEDVKFVESLGIKNCWGTAPKPFTSYAHWSIDRKKNIYLIEVGGGMHDIPFTADLWWNGSIVRVEYDNSGTTGNGRIGVDFVTNVTKIIVPKSLWNKRDELVDLIFQGFSVIYWATDKEDTKSITVNVQCQPIQATKGDAYGE